MCAKHLFAKIDKICQISMSNTRKESKVNEFLPPIPETYCHAWQGRNHGKNLGATVLMVDRICTLPPGLSRVKVSESIGPFTVALVALVDTSLKKSSNRSFFTKIKFLKLKI